MKIRHLHINNFGHFADRDIALSDAGLQVIYGPNEAGKTTLLEFLRCWLFDFPTRTPYDFKAGTEISGVGELSLSDGRLVELRRRKGAKNKVAVKINGGDTDLDEVGFAGLIGNANRNLFESVFAFGLDQLSQGEESLKHESMQSALFGGGLGSAGSPEQIANELDRQAAGLFLPNARTKPTINVLVGEIKELTAQVKSKTLRPDDFQKRRDAADAADVRAAEIHAQVEQLRREHSRVEKLSRAWRKWWELGQQQAERAPLAVPAALPTDARQRHAGNLTRQAEAGEECVKHAATIAKTGRDLASLQLDPRAISLRTKIEACLQLKQSTVDARRDLPERIAQRDATREQVDSELNELRPGWGHDDLRAFSVDVATRAEIDRLAAEDRTRSLAGAELRAKREGIESKLRDAQADLAALGESRDTAAFVAALADEAGYLTDVKQLQTRQSELAKIERQHAAQLRKLTPPLPVDAAAPQTLPQMLPAPRLETIVPFETDFDELREQLRAAVDSARQDAEEQRELQSQIDGAASDVAVPSLDERDSRRRRRDAGWDLIRQRHVERQPASEEVEAEWIGGAAGSLIEAYAQAVCEADEIADSIYAKADAVARREGLRRRLDDIAKRLVHKQAAIEDLRRREAELQARWLALWAECGFEPLAPNAMRRWLVDHEAVCETIAERDELVAEIEQLAQRKTKFEDRLRAACCSQNGDGPQNGGGSQSQEFSLLQAVAHRAVDESREQQRRTAELRREIKRLEPQHAQCDQELAALDQSMTSWQAAWKSVLGRLNLPGDWSADLARTVIERLKATRVKLDGLPHEETRIAAMRSRIEEFDAKVRPLCQALAPELLEVPAELAIVKLSDQLGRAAEAQRQHEQLQNQLAAAHEQLKLVEDRQATLLAEQTALFAAAEANSEAEFLEVVSRSERIAQLDADIERLTREIDLIRMGEDQAEFEQALQVDFELLESQRLNLAEHVQVATQRKSEADGAAAVAKSEVARLDGSGEAAALLDALSRKRAQLAAEVDRYAPLLLARRLLADGVRRFDRENQPEMIATVSRLMTQMTAGRYTEFDRTGGDRKTIVIRRSDGVERTPNQLSTGTREQLYLAIRLGYVLHYCRQNEPLPIVMDDVLVNFDDARARQTLATLADVAGAAQVLFFTCHPHLVGLAREVVAGLQPIDLSAPAAIAASAVPSAVARKR